MAYGTIVRIKFQGLTVGILCLVIAFLQAE